MFLNKIKNRESGILLYGITPPKVNTTLEKLTEISQKTFDHISPLDIDALIVYDVQDEAERTTEERPFPFMSALDPLVYSSQYLTQLNVPKIMYRPASKFSNEELKDWLQTLATNNSYPVFVGLPSPDYIPKTTLTEAYEIWRTNHEHHSVIGAVIIPERHIILKDEDIRVLDKVNSGVSYFVSQCIFDMDCTTQTLDAIVDTFGKRNHPIPTIIFTLTICGSLKTLSFMEWLGINVPNAIKDELSTCENPTIRSVEIATAIAAYLIQYCKEKEIPFGFNIESVAIRKEEINASLELLTIISNMLKSNGMREEVKRVGV
jgi:hypothetical protein